MKDGKSKMLTAKTCFGHLGGTLGERLFVGLIELGWFARDGEKRTVYTITDLGVLELQKLGIDIYDGR